MPMDGKSWLAKGRERSTEEAFYLVRLSIMIFLSMSQERSDFFPSPLRRFAILLLESSWKNKFYPSFHPLAELREPRLPWGYQEKISPAPGEERVFDPSSVFSWENTSVPQKGQKNSPKKRKILRNSRRLRFSETPKRGDSLIFPTLISFLSFFQET